MPHRLRRRSTTSRQKLLHRGDRRKALRRLLVEQLEDRRLLTLDLDLDITSGSESAETVITITATNNDGGGVGSPVVGDQTVDLSVTGAGITSGDYSLSQSTITILDGDTSGTATFTIVNDYFLEGAETATIALTNPSAGLEPIGVNDLDVDIVDDEALTTDLNYDSDAGEDFGLEVLGGGDIRVTIDGVNVGDYPTITSFTFTDTSGGGEDNTLTLDMTNGLVDFPLTFDAGAGTDDVVLQGGAADTLEFQYDNLTDGSVTWQNGATSTLSYTGLDPLVSTITAANVELTYLGGAETITVDDGGAGSTEVSSTLGELTTFTNPTASLTINAGAGDDTIDLDGFGAGFAAALTINGDGDDDAINLNTALTLAGGATGNVDFTAEDITVSAALDTTAGTVGMVTLTADNLQTIAAGDITAGDEVTLTGATEFDMAGDVTTSGQDITVNGPVELDANVALSSAGGNILFSDSIVDDGGVSNRDLTVDAGAGTISILGDIGAGTDPDEVSLQAASITASNIATATELEIINSAAVTLGGVISGSGGLVKSGAGSLELTAANTYAGGTSVADGILLANNAAGSATGSGLVTVTGGGQLGGTGAVSDVSSAGVLAPGDGGTADLAAGATLLTGGSFDAEINTATPDTGHDQLVVTGSVDLGAGAAALNLSGTFLASSAALTSVVLIDNDGADSTTGHFTGLTEGSPVAAPGGGVFFITYNGGDGNDVVLNTQPIVNGTSAADTVTLRRSGADFEFNFNGNGFINIGAVPNFTFNGQGGDDVLIVDYVGGAAIPTGGVFYNGQGESGATGDVLQVVGTGAETADYLADGTAGPDDNDGTVTIGGGVITFTGLEPVDLIGMAVANVLLPNADDVIAIDNGTVTGGADALVVSGTSGGVAFESVHLRNNDQVNIDTTSTDGDDSITVNSGDNAHGNTNVLIESGLGTDSVTFGGTLEVTGDVEVNSQAIAFDDGAIVATGVASDVNLGAGAGAISTSGAALDIEAVTLTAVASTGIDLDTDLDTVDVAATSGAAADIQIDDVGTVFLADVSTVDGNIAVTAAVDLVVLFVDSGAAVDLMAVDNAFVAGVVLAIDAIDVSGDTVTVDALASLDGDSVDLDAADVVTVSGTVDAFSGDVELDAVNTVTVDGIIGFFADIGGSVLINQDPVATSAVVDLTGPIGAEGEVRIHGASVTVDSAVLADTDGVGGEDVTIVADGDVTQNAGSIESTSGGIFITSNTGSVEILGGLVSDGPDQAGGSISSITGGADAAIQLLADVDVTVANVAASAGNVEVVATTGDILLGSGADDGILDAETVFLEAADVDGEILDNNGAATDVTAVSLAMLAHSGIGSGDALETTVSTLAADNTEANDILVDNVGGLTIGTVGSLAGVDNTDPLNTPAGLIAISTTSPITVDDDVTADGSITLTALDSAAIGDDLTVAGQDTAGTNAVEIVSNYGPVTLNAGDDLTIPGASAGTVVAAAAFVPIIQAGALTSGANDIFINVDNAATRVGADPDVGTGADVFVGDQTLFIDDATATGPFSSFVNAAIIAGGDDNDLFELFPQEDVSGRTGAPIVLDGSPPVFGDAGVPPGDTLLPNFTSLSSPPPTLLIGPAAGSGQYSFAPGVERPIGYVSIETVDSTDPFHLALDLDVTGGGADVLMQLDAPTSENIELHVGTRPAFSPATEVFEADVDDVLSVQIYGDSATTPNSLTVDDVNGLPVLPGTLPATLIYGAAAPNNPVVGGTPSVYFNGRGGLGDALYYELSGGDTSQTYGMGDGAGGGFSSDFGTAEGEVITVDPSNTQVDGFGGTDQVLYFTGLEPITTSGTPGGTLTVVGDAENQLIQVVDADASTQTPAPVGTDYTRVQGFNENHDVQPYRMAPYEFLDFQADSFTELVIQGLEGDDILDVISLAGEETSAGLATVGITLEGGVDNDIISVADNGPANAPITADGGDGDDQISVAEYGAVSRVGLQTERTRTEMIEPFLITPVVALGGPGEDSLRVDDSEQTSGFSYEFVLGATEPLAVSRDGTIAVDYDAIEDLTVESGSDSDTFVIDELIVAPGVTTIDDGGGAADRLDFSLFAGGGLSWDMDTEAQQSLLGLDGGPQLRAIGTIENFTGTAADDVVYVDPLPGVPRDLLGGAPNPGDNLLYDPLGEAVTDDGSGTLTFSGGLGDITHAEFEAAGGGNAVFVDGDAPPALIVDNLDPGFSATGGFVTTTNPYSHLGDHAGDTTPGDGDEAAWTFDDIPNGVYSVMLTWAPDGQNAIDAPFAIHDGASSADPVIGGKLVDQTQSVSTLPFVDPAAPGTEWVTIGIVTVSGNALTVSVTDAITDRDLPVDFPDEIRADAVRIEMLPLGVSIDDGDAGFSAGGFTQLPEDTHRGRLGDVHVAGAGQGTASWTSDPLPGGTYLVSSSYVAYNAADTGDVTTTGYDSNAPFSVNGQPAVLINQEGFSANSFDMGGMTWQPLDTVTIADGGVITVELGTTGITKSVAADAIYIQPIGGVDVADGGGPVADGGTLTFGPTQLGDPETQTVTITNTGLGHLNLSDLEVQGLTIATFGGQDQGFEATQGFGATSLPPGGSTTFDVRMNADLDGDYTGEASFASDAFDPHTELNLEGEVGIESNAVIVDDRYWWASGGGTFSAPGFTYGVSRDSYQITHVRSLGGNGNVATWDLSGLNLSDGLYQVATVWAAGGDRVTDANYTISADAVTPVSVNQQLAPVGFTSDGSTWQELATVSVTGGSLVVTLDDTLSDPGLVVIADAIRVQRVDVQIVDELNEFSLVDDGDPEFSSNGTPTVHYANDDLLNDDMVSLDGPGETAEWTFHTTPGFYEVGVSWDSFRDHATDVFYTITIPGQAPVVVGPVDQNLPAADDQLAAGTATLADFDSYQILTTIEVPALLNQITVTVSGTATGLVDADSAFVRRVADPVLPLLASSSQQAAPLSLTQAELDVAVSTAVDAWLGAGLNERQMRSLQSLDVRLAAIPGNTLGFASPSTGQVFIDRDSAGLGSGVYDLGSIVAHEIGHILGYDDLYDVGSRTDVMHGILSPGQSRLPLSALDAALDGLLNEDLTRDVNVSVNDETEDTQPLRSVMTDPAVEADDDSTVSELLLSLVERRKREQADVDAFFGALEEEEEGEQS